MTLTVKPSIWSYNLTDNREIFTGNVKKVRPISSIAKLMTVMISLDSGADLTEVLPLSTMWEHIIPAGNYTRQELIDATLITSDNCASETLAENYPGGRDKFIEAMNIKAQSLGMTQTVFTDASGVSADSVSLPQDIHYMLVESLKYDLIKTVSTTKERTLANGTKIENNNYKMLNKFDLVVNKTGQTVAAECCVGTILNHNEKQYSLVLMGISSPLERFIIASKIINHHLL